MAYIRRSAESALSGLRLDGRLTNHPAAALGVIEGSPQTVISATSKDLKNHEDTCLPLDVARLYL
jgi:hypothetical protein